ncbi:MAG: InlB B-repeat-containing protein [Eubacterium sp.]|nr:InlB B-repeat-containing protein [Eubacterium sp.]
MDVTSDGTSMTGDLIQNQTIILPEIEKDGYILEGWYDAPDGGNLIGQPGDEYKVTDDFHFYAHWKPAEGSENAEDADEADDAEKKSAEEAEAEEKLNEITSSDLYFKSADGQVSFAKISDVLTRNDLVYRKEKGSFEFQNRISENALYLNDDGTLFQWTGQDQADCRILPFYHVNSGWVKVQLLSQKDAVMDYIDSELADVSIEQGLEEKLEDQTGIWTNGRDLIYTDRNDALSGEPYYAVISGRRVFPTVTWKNLEDFIEVHKEEKNVPMAGVLPEDSIVLYRSGNSAYAFRVIDTTDLTTGDYDLSAAAPAGLINYLLETRAGSFRQITAILEPESLEAVSDGDYYYDFKPVYTIENGIIVKSPRRITAADLFIDCSGNVFLPKIYKDGELDGLSDTERKELQEDTLPWGRRWIYCRIPYRMKSLENGWLSSLDEHLDQKKADIQKWLTNYNDQFAGGEVQIAKPVEETDEPETKENPETESESVSSESTTDSEGTVKDGSGQETGKSDSDENSVSSAAGSSSSTSKSDSVKAESSTSASSPSKDANAAGTISAGGSLANSTSTESSFAGSASTSSSSAGSASTSSSSAGSASTSSSSAGSASTSSSSAASASVNSSSEGSSGSRRGGETIAGGAQAKKNNLEKDSTDRSSEKESAETESAQ